MSCKLFSVVVVFVGGHVCMQLTEDDLELKDDLFPVRSVYLKVN